MKRINIITPITKNSNPNSILNLVLSITQQITDKRIEILHIIVNCDYGNKKLEKLLNKINLYKFVRVLNIKSKNINSARNIAIKSNDADYILHLETTDIIHPYFILSMLNKELNNQTNKIILSNWKLLKNQNLFKIKVNITTGKMKYVDNISNCFICPYRIANEYLFDENIFLGFEYWDIILRYINNRNQFQKINNYGFFKTNYFRGYLNCSLKEYKLVMQYFFIKYPDLYKKSILTEYKTFIGFLNCFSIKNNFLGKKYESNLPNFYMNMNL